MKIKRFTPPPPIAYVVEAVLIDDLELGAVSLDPSYHTFWVERGIDTGSPVLVRRSVEGSRPSLSNGQWLVRLSTGTRVVAHNSTLLRQYVYQCGQEWPDD